MGKSTPYDHGLKQLLLAEMKPYEFTNDDPLSSVDVYKTPGALSQPQYPVAQAPVESQFFAQGGQPKPQHFADGAQPDPLSAVNAASDAAQQADLMAAFKNLGNIGSGLPSPKAMLLNVKQMGVPYRPAALQQMTVIPQLAALLQARGMRLAGGGSADHEHPHYDGTPAFRTGGLDGLGGKYVEGKGDGTSDDITAMLANGEYVLSADVVSALGNGSNKAGAKELDGMVQAIRERARSSPADKLPPDAKAPLEYIRSSKGNKHG